MPPSPKFELRAATPEDFDFAWTLYRDLMKSMTEALVRWNQASQKAVVREAVSHRGSAVIVVEDKSVGWLQVVDRGDAIYLAQIYLRASSQNRGIGSAIVQELCARARREGKAVTLEVMKNNPARSFYLRRGFSIIGQSEHKLELRWRESP